MIEIAFSLPDNEANDQIRIRYSSEHKLEVEVLDGIIGDL